MNFNASLGGGSQTQGGILGKRHVLVSTGIGKTLGLSFRQLGRQFLH